MGDMMAGRRILVTGVRNKWSIAWHSALALHREGAQLAFSVFGDREANGVRKLMAEAGFVAPILFCDATSEEQVSALFRDLAALFDGRLDGLLHAIAFANKDDLGGEYCATSADGFSTAHLSSVYTLIAFARAARPMLQSAGGGSIVTLSYVGAERVIPSYNVMGVAKASLEASVRYLASDLGPENIRVNAVSAGPIKTLAAGAIANFDTMLKLVAERSPLRRAVDAGEVGDTVMFLLSSLARGITGEILHVDAGYNIMG